MDNFRSEAILQDRLTLQPDVSHGLFQNGRISTPNPVGELAYNSMTAVENPISLISSRAQHNKSRAKEKQRRGREVDEMVAYFGHKETPPNELLPAATYGGSNIYGNVRKRSSTTSRRSPTAAAR
ncbi:hypothetical protein CGCSCA4_v013577 [Colletotrichum siamense]|uniref:Uncharacterized protein n=1 Tax=Colletotrichum siamense TaxID=690259 RepID=A0A9P5BNH1_COLSI|nr:hypothetical protein CGCSCA4_v013577 [Colletotrichum siamense]KAF4845538.1 hypothetical protein CGCSCA2_v013627 [Colletotrichum siamense]